jgi:hypothetical protein
VVESDDRRLLSANGETVTGHNYQIDTLREEWNRVDDQRLAAMRDQNLEMEIIAMAQLDVLEDQIDRLIVRMQESHK